MRSITSIVSALLAATPAIAATPVEEVTTAAPAAPDYSDPAMWTTAAASLPPGATPPANAPQVDVFYVHPTILRGARPLNQDVGDASVNRMTDESAIARQASAFNGCCAVHAPRYRAAGPGRLVTPAQRAAAFAIAYSDVERAFDWFLANVSKGRPFILAGHSQGAAHIADLVERRIDGTPLQRRMVAAYAVGTNVAEGEFGLRFRSVKPCPRAGETGCIVQWNSLALGGDLEKTSAALRKSFSDRYGDKPGGTAFCINPVTFDARKPDSLSADSKGAVPGDPGHGAMAALVPGRVAVSCKKGLAVVAHDPALGITAQPGGSLHYHDIGLFWADVRANATLRSNAWLAGESARRKEEDAELRRRYALPNSRFITVAGQSLHYVDEGKGPPVILVHGSYDSLRSWDSWAAALKHRYRVIRFDRPFSGLSGPAPDGRGDGLAEARLIGLFADHLRLGRFALVGTSSSGEGAAHFAATSRERVSALILANIAARPFRPDPSHMSAEFRAIVAADAKLGGWHMPELWRGVLEMNWFDRGRITSELVTRWTDLNNRFVGARRVQRPDGQRFFSGTPVDLAAIRAPTLLLWSDKDPETPVETHGQEALSLLGSADKALVVIPHCGHMMPEECGAPSAAAALEFLNRVLP